MLTALSRSRALRGFYRKWWERAYGVSRDDVFLVSYPRSGNTWVRFMLLQARPDFCGEDFLRIGEIVPDMHSPTPWFHCRRAKIVKSHLTYWQPFRRVVYLVRDGRAATYSNWKYQRDEGKHGLSFAEYLKQPRWPSRWGDHVAGWVGAPETKLVIRYEELCADPAAQLKKLCDFLGWPSDDARISRIVENSSKETMRQMERSGSVPLHRVGEAAAESWRNAFDSETEAAFLSVLEPRAAAFLESGNGRP